MSAAYKMYARSSSENRMYGIVPVVIFLLLENRLKQKTFDTKKCALSRKWI